MSKRVLQIEETLGKMDIHSFEDYISSVSAWGEFDERVFNGGQDKIDLLRNMVVDYFSSYDSIRFKGQYISIDAKTSEDKLIENYLCMFPKRSLIETSALMSYIDFTPHNGSSYDMPPNDFIKQFYRFKDLLKKDIAYLYPCNTSEESHVGSEIVIDSNSIIKLRNVIDVRREGNIYDIVNHMNECFLVFPWLYNARVGDFLEICDKYPAEFEKLSLTIEKLAASMNGDGDFRIDALKDMQDALVNLKIEFETKAAELKRKGVITTVGLVLTVLPPAISFFTNNTLPEAVSIGQNILGTTSLIGSKSLLDDYFSIKTLGNTDPYWVLWKWQQKTEERNK